MKKIFIEGTAYEYPDKTTYYQVAREHEKRTGSPILLVKENYNLRELHHTIQDGANVELLTLRSQDAHKAYQRSLCLMMLKAVDYIGIHDERYEVSIHFAVGNGLYCTLKDPSCVTDDFLVNVEEYMRQMSRRGLRIKKTNVSTAKARQIFRERRQYDKEQVFAFRMNSRTNLYELEGYIDYYYGYMLYDTSYLKKFSLRRYDEGFVMTFPTSSDPDRLPVFEPGEKLFHTQKKSLEWGKSLGIMDVGDLNHEIVSGRGKEIMLIQEAYHEKQIAQIAQQIADRKDCKFIMIAGPSSSGKTSFSHRLSVQLTVQGMRPHPIELDDYFLNREDTPLNEDGTYNFECLEALDIEQFNQDMQKLLTGEKVELPSFNFKTGKREYNGNYKQLGPDDVLVIEGIHGLNDKLSYTLPKESKFKIYISALTQLCVDEHNRIAMTDGRKIRRIVRDARTRGTNAASTIAMWDSVRRGESEYIFPFQETSDVMFNSSLIYELAVLKIYAQPLLFGIAQDSPEYAEAKRLLKFLDYFMPLPADYIPINSLLREFVGGSCFDV